MQEPPDYIGLPLSARGRLTGWCTELRTPLLHGEVLGRMAKMF